ncbi:MAG: hypothetical protein A3E02_01135 [Candidatus Zambryskibacteria bacterium RIFCSPHIGHO2_12_FULL_38_34]|nr:MAG: hypothetical protein A3E02_01135 [Candidatus Zambryskibacteria bacterium RIFCSPHIGHO2_12_FULL_38_34]
MENIDLIDKLTLILTALSAFFTLITGAFAVFVSLTIFYFKKLKDDRENEIKKLIQLEDDLMNKIKETEGLKSNNKTEIEEIKKEYSDLRNRFFHLTTPTAWQVYGNEPVRDSSPTKKELIDQINSLLAMIASLQAQMIQTDKKK